MWAFRLLILSNTLGSHQRTQGSEQGGEGGPPASGGMSAPGQGPVPLTLSAGKDAPALGAPGRLGGPPGAGAGAGGADRLPPVALGPYL